MIQSEQVIFSFSLLPGINKKQDHASLRMLFVLFPSKKEMSVKLALSFSETVDMGLVTQRIEENLVIQVRGLCWKAKGKQKDARNQSWGWGGW